MSRMHWYYKRAVDTLRYEGPHILLWRTLLACLSPLGGLELWTLYQRDLTKPLGEVRAKVGVVVTQATEADIDQLATLVARRYGPTKDIGPYHKLGIQATLLRRFRRNLRCFVGKIGTEIVHYNWLTFHTEESLGGAGIFIMLKDDEGYCADAYTAEAWRGQGIHAAVLNQMLLFLRQAGYQRAYTDVGIDNKSSWKTHQRLGWEVRGTMLDFRPSGVEKMWVWRVSGTLSPFIVQPGRFLSFSTVSKSEPE